MSSFTLVTVDDDGNTTKQILKPSDITREMLRAWKAENEAWEEYCRDRQKADQDER